MLDETGNYKCGITENVLEVSFLHNFYSGKNEEKRERGLIIQGLMVVKIQRPYLWRDPFFIRVPAPSCTANA